MSSLRPAKYRALKDLKYPTSPAVLHRLTAGENVSWAERHNKSVKAGDIVSDIPAASIPVLLEKGWIEEVKEGKL
jgi:hypothetical protein